jgi:hypothetical protein
LASGEGCAKSGCGAKSAAQATLTSGEKPACAKSAAAATASLVKAEGSACSKTKAQTVAAVEGEGCPKKARAMRAAAMLTSFDSNGDGHMCKGELAQAKAVLTAMIDTAEKGSSCPKAGPTGPEFSAVTEQLTKRLATDDTAGPSGG